MKAHEVLSDESKWTRGELARNNTGDACDETSSLACQWCIVGAIFVAYPLTDENIAANKKIQNKLDTSAHDWNDDPTTTFDDVRNLLLELDI